MFSEFLPAFGYKFSSFLGEKENAGCRCALDLNVHLLSLLCLIVQFKRANVNYFLGDGGGWGVDLLK